MEIRFGVWKKEKINGKNETISKNDVIDIPITMEQFQDKDDRFKVHKIVMDAVYEKYPGWNLMGYCPKGYGRDNEK